MTSKLQCPYNLQAYTESLRPLKVFICLKLSGYWFQAFELVITERPNEDNRLTASSTTHKVLMPAGGPVVAEKEILGVTRFQGFVVGRVLAWRPRGGGFAALHLPSSHCTIAISLSRSLWFDDRAVKGG